MIKATVLKDSTDSGNVIYRGIVMEGHAGYAQEGEDIICAAVSALSLNFFNSVETFTEDEFEGRAGQELSLIHIYVRTLSAASSGK